MSMKSKFAAAALVALTLAGTAAVTTREAAAGPRERAAIGFGIAAGTVLAIAAANQAYGYRHGYASCRLVPRYNAYTGYVTHVQVCGW